MEYVLFVWSYITANEGFLKRTLDYISFMFSAVVASCYTTKVDVVIGTSPQFFTVCAAYFVSITKRIPWVFELRDIWPESIKAVGALNNSSIIRFLEKIEIFLYRKASLIVSVTQSFRENLVQRGIGRDKIHVVTNGVDAKRFSPAAKDQELVKLLELKDKFVVGYIGTHGLPHARQQTVLDGAKRLQKNNKNIDFCFILLGDGANKASLVQYAENENIENVLFVDSVAKEEVSPRWSLLDISVIHLKKTELFQTVIPL